ncbi:MAG: hypothetical protein GPOALKHO_000004 [Sodalis sp.]|nr:MAG: hypothetical protein GPOALKHO_000004 [Sodalis sp.]
MKRCVFAQAVHAAVLCQLSAKETSLAALAGELPISLGKLVWRLRKRTPPNDFTSAQKSVLL